MLKNNDFLDDSSASELQSADDCAIMDTTVTTSQWESHRPGGRHTIPAGVTLSRRDRKRARHMYIEPGRIINDFIEPNKHQYTVPVYQRNYEWSREQCVKLFRDIVQAYRNDKTHFCGMVVHALLCEKKGIYYHVIIDGQQRFTTIYILIKALLDLSDTDATREKFSEVIFNKDKFSEYAVDQQSKLKLKPIKSDNRQLMLLMENRFDEMDKTGGIWENYQLFCDLIRQTLAEGVGVKDIYRGLEKLICAKIRLDPEDNAQEIFERINSTGVPLSLADQIRNFVLMTDADQERLYQDYWLMIERLVNKDQLTAFFLNYLNIKIEGFAKESEAYETFKAIYRENGYTNESILSELLHYAEYYHAFLYGDDSKYSPRVNELLLSLQQLKQTTVFLFLFRIFDDYDRGVIDSAALEKVLAFLLNYSIRRLICEIGSNSLRGLYKTLYARVFAKEQYKAHYYDAVISFFLQLTSKDAMPDDDAFLAALREKNLYRKNALCRFLLAAIENRGKERLCTDNLTIEHILPQNKNLSTSWQLMLGDHWQEDRDRLLHTLGNLTLTGYNSELGDKPFDEKKELLDAVHTKVVVLFEDVRTRERWDAAAIEARADRLAGVILALYPIVPPEYQISFADPRYREYSCEDPEEATHKTPNYYVLRGERVRAVSFADMLRTLIRRLYDSDPAPIEQMARRDERLLPWSHNIMFSYDPEKVSKDSYYLKDTAIYVSQGFSSSHIIQIIRALLDKYEIDRDEFAYSARSGKADDNS